MSSAAGTTSLTTPSAVRLLGRHVTPGEDVAHGDLLRDHAGQAVHAAGARHQPDARLGQAERGRGRRPR